MNQKCKGFTLIELLVVISIIAMLLAILMPALSKVKEKAREVICRTHLRSVGLGMLLYIEDYDGKAFNSSGSNSFFWKDTNGDYLTPNVGNPYWGVAYKDYIGDPDIFECPSFTRVTQLIYPVDPELIKQAAFGLNFNIYNIENASSEDRKKKSRKLSGIRSHANFIVAHDHVEPRMDGGNTDMFYNSGPGTNNLTQYRSGGSRSQYYRGIFRHSMSSNDQFETKGNANMLWLDGHVDSLKETTGDDVKESWYKGK